MTNRDLINLLLDFPMDMEVSVGLPREDGAGLDCWAINTGDVGEVGDKGEEIIILSYEDYGNINPKDIN